MEAPFHRWYGDTLVLRLRVQPRSSRNSLGDLFGDRIKLYLTAPPVDGKANTALIAYLAEAFGTPKSRIRIRRGELGREKDIEIEAPTRLPPGIPPATAP
ncbi:MAG: DUF167 family protein [Acidihalobacter sp.]